MAGRRRRPKDPTTQRWLGRRAINKAAKENRSEGAGVPGSEHAGDHHYHFKRGRWVLKPEYRDKK